MEAAAGACGHAGPQRVHGVAIPGGTLLLTTDGAMLLRASMAGVLTPRER